MIYSVTGKVEITENGYAVIQTNGIGFRVQTSLNTRKDLKIGSNATLYTYLNVREDAMELFGFSSTSELDTFKILISINGVGPKAALSILSSLTSEQLALCVSNGDFKSITVAQGVGPKLAQRIVLEMKDKVKNILVENKAYTGTKAVQSSKISQAVSALAVLGYSAAEVTPVLSKLDQSLGVEEMIRETMKAMKKG